MDMKFHEKKLDKKGSCSQRRREKVLSNGSIRLKIIRNWKDKKCKNEKK